MTPIKLNYSEALIRHSVRSFWWRRVRFKLILCLIVTMISLAYQVSRGSYDSTFWLSLAIVAVAFVILPSAYFVELRRSLEKVRKMKVPEGSIELSENGYTLVSELGSSEMQWTAIKKVWRFESYWIVELVGGGQFTLPTADLTTEAKELIVRKAKAL